MDNDVPGGPPLRPRRSAAPRLYHRKSRMGCLRCKARRVKCDEQRPFCGSCSRHQVECVYPQAEGSLAQHAPAVQAAPAAFAPAVPAEDPPIGGGSSSPSSTNSPSPTVREANDYLSQLTDPDILDLPESRDRRMWELRLVHNYCQLQAQQFHNRRSRALHGDQPQPGITLRDEDLDPNNPDAKNPYGSFVWGREIPKLAFQNDAILYSMLASSALDMLIRVTDPQEEEQLRVLQGKYFAMALREQRHAVASLSRDNADMVCMGAMTILQNSFSLVQTLPARPWQPPMEWLRMGKGAGAVLVVARGYLGFQAGGSGGGGGGDERITRLLASTPRMDPEDVFRPEYRAHLTWLLDNDRGSTDTIGDHELEGDAITCQSTLEIYLKVLSFVGYVQRAIADNAEIYMIIRRFIGFSMLMSGMYHEFIAQRRARALITLAHFFKLWIPYRDLWLIGNAGENQVRGIYEELPEKWKHKVACIFEEYNLQP